MVKLPKDLHQQITNALGKEIPMELGSIEEVNALGNEISAKAPGLFRAYADVISETTTKALRQRPVALTSKPPGWQGIFYRKDKDGNWVPDRMRYVALSLGIIVLFVAFAMLMIEGSRPRPAAKSTAATEATAEPTIVVQPTNAAATTDAPNPNPLSADGASQQPDSRIPPPPTSDSDSTSDASSATSSPLPGPDPNFPPPPDASTLPPGAAPGSVLVDDLQVVPGKKAAGGEGAGQGLSVLARTKAEGAQSETATPHFQSRKEAPGAEGQFQSRTKAESSDSQQPALFISRGKAEGGTPSTPADGWTWIKKGDGERSNSEGIGLTGKKSQPEADTPTILWRRETTPATPGIIPPSQAATPAGTGEAPPPADGPADRQGP